MAQPTRKKRIPTLTYTENRGMGFYVSYRDPKTGQPKKHKFGKIPRNDAVTAYENWLADHLKGKTSSIATAEIKSAIVRGPRKLVEQIGRAKTKSVQADIVPGCLLQIASNFLTYEQSRVRADDGPRPQNTITAKQYGTRKQFTEDFLSFLNSKHGDGAVGRMKVADLSMEDVEDYSGRLVSAHISDSQLRKRMQCIKAISDRAGRPENGGQLLTWNWDSMDARYGRPEVPIQIPTLLQLKLVLRECDVQHSAMVLLAIGCGFGQRDLAAIRVGDIDDKSYDLRRPKTGIDRYGETPKLVWASVQRYLAKVPRPHGELMFLTQRKRPLVHGTGNDAVQQWWDRLRESLGEMGQGLNGFYSLRHLARLSLGPGPVVQYLKCGAG